MRTRVARPAHGIAASATSASGDAPADVARGGVTCVSCGREIPPARMRVVPGAVRCVRCQLRFEATAPETA
ncbi:MAG: TraR/DksA C4-type zinc finger protein [Thermoleophilaceae bacterium]|nr:TraR/DksA C4-type zinc finger protein [Thermoleophilaceae bacterium]